MLEKIRISSNKRKDLHGLFIKAMNSTSIPIHYGGTSGMSHGRAFMYIQFYEWSDVNRIPKVFYSMEAFTRFLTTSGLSLKGFQVDAINALNGRVHVACKKGSSELVVRSTKQGLESALSANDGGVTHAPTIPLVNGLPSSVRPSGVPPMYGGVSSPMCGDDEPYGGRWDW